MYWNVHDSINNTSSNTGISNLDGLLDVAINNPQADQVLSFNGSQFINTAVPGLSAVQSNFNNLNADNLKSGTIAYARLPNLAEITLSGDAVPPYISSITPITPSGPQEIEILGEYFSPITSLSIPGVTVNNLEVRSPNKIIASITKTGLSGNKIITLSNGSNSNQLWSEGIKSVDIFADPYGANVALFIKGDGENNSINIIDSSPTPKTLTRFGDIKISTAQKKYGNSSIYFDGGGDYLEFTSSGLVNSSIFTLEAWVFPSSSFSSGFFDTGPGSVGVLRHFDNNFENQNMGGVPISLDTNQWSHVAIVFNGSAMRVFKNGILIGSVNFSSWVHTTLLVGSINRAWFFHGYLDSLRLTLGVARYVVNFNPETDTYLNA